LKVRFKLKVNNHSIDIAQIHHRHSGGDSRWAIPPNALWVNASLFQTDLCRNPEPRDVIGCAYLKTAQM
jgi:hypothetical protein